MAEIAETDGTDTPLSLVALAGNSFSSVLGSKIHDNQSTSDARYHDISPQLYSQATGSETLLNPYNDALSINSRYRENFEAIMSSNNDESSGDTSHLLSSSLSRMQQRYHCECCPRKPRSFGSQEGLK